MLAHFAGEEVMKKAYEGVLKHTFQKKHFRNVSIHGKFEWRRVRRLEGSIWMVVNINFLAFFRYQYTCFRTTFRILNYQTSRKFLVSFKKTSRGIQKIF